MFKKLISLFLVWRLTILIILLFSLILIPLQGDFLGGGLTEYLKRPLLWAHVNFDGEHYLSIAKYGYKPLTYFFFPLYPLLARSLASIFGGGYISNVYSGLTISYAAFVLALCGLMKLIDIDYKKNISWLTIVLLLLFPTSFYFVNYYTESIFLAFTVWSFYFARKGKWFYAGLLGAFSTATRVVGLALFPALLIEYFN